MTLLCDNAELGTLMLIMLLDPILVPQLFALALVVAKNLPSICPWPAPSFPILEKLFASAGLTERFRRHCVSALHRLADSLQDNAACHYIKLKIISIAIGNSRNLL